MHYLLGGAARAGKSAIARQFLRETGIPFFCLDWLMMGLAQGLPATGVDPDDDELAVGVLLWPVVRPLALALVEDEVDYLIEGVQLHPQQVRQLYDQAPGQVRGCFVGYVEIDVMAKFRQLRRYGGGADDWLRYEEDDQLVAQIERLKALSRRLRTECACYRVPYFETTTDRDHTVTEVVRYFRQANAPV
jgi:hypothetical protein